MEEHVESSEITGKNSKRFTREMKEECRFSLTWHAVSPDLFSEYVDNVHSGVHQAFSWICC